MEAIAAGDEIAAATLLAASPELARRSIKGGATRQISGQHFLAAVSHYIYAGDTALHIAAAGYAKGIAELLVYAGADVRARNRRGAEPLHYAADGVPGSSAWNPQAQAATLTCLLGHGADPNCVDGSGVTPLHRAVRTRCAAAVEALLEGGADVHRPNTRGTTPIKLARMNTGRGGSGSAEAKDQQAEILAILTAFGAE